MVSWQEDISRWKEYYGFNRQEFISGVVIALVTGFLFSFRDWGTESFSLIAGVINLLLATIAALISIWFKLSCQKLYGLSEGYKVYFKPWWTGVGIAAVVAFVTFGRVPLLILGTVSAVFMVRHRLGEFRYGYSHWNYCMIMYWGLMSHLIMDILFAIGLHFSPQNYFFNKGLWMNLIAGFCLMIPLPQMDGLNIWFGKSALYYIGWVLLLLASVLLLTKTTFGLLFCITAGLTYAAIYMLIGSEK